MRVSALSIYPLKSGRAISLEEAVVDRMGLAGDRRLVVTDPDGDFITQRDLQALARLRVLPEGDGYRLSFENEAALHVSPSASGDRLGVTVWGSDIDAAVSGAEINDRLSTWLGRPVRLAWYDGRSRRSASAEWSAEETPVSFADGFPILVTTEASLEALNRDMEAHGEGRIGMERFRPNIVIDSSEAWEEDFWEAIEIGGIRFDLVKPCARCIMTTQDQETGSRDVPSPMPAMGRLRMSADRRVPGPLFGWNAAPRGEGRLRLGDAVRVISRREDGWRFKRR
ncbi:MOSC domain-containing protein [Gellertiella hungarica]|uniref:MOSC domain-containing protein n=1 Tax=Gellertiella hungarica TaxID=1572859 RepID=A0A7W6J816_9HYPH|nr:MOSC domain-containing protein [Gellertiella hungarica]MBB4065598.1 hypothetical protein [Gellertiella hungarica]